MFPQLFEMVPDALIVVDASGRIVVANHQAEALFGYPPQGLTGLSVEQLIPEDVRTRHRGHRAGYMASPRIRPMGDGGMALIGLRKDGATFPVEIALSPLYTGDSLQYLASIRDISETQRARQALVRARYDALVARIGQQAVESTDEQGVVAGVPGLLEDALSVETVAVVLLREDGRPEIHASHGAKEETLGAPENQEDTPPAFAISNQAWIVEDLAREPQAFPLIGAKEGSGAVVPLLNRDRPIGAVFAWSSKKHRFDHDALHLMQSVANLLAALLLRRRTEDQLAHSQRLDAIGQLTGGIAHDFNNLLTVMSGSLQLLELQYGEQPEAAELIASALRSVARGAELTGKLLAFARRQRLVPSAVAPQRLLHDMEQMLRRTLGDTIRLKVACADTVPAAYVDASQLDSALLNLALNARDAMPRGGDITVVAEERQILERDARRDLPAGRYVVFSVADTGIGMASETLSRAVEPFYTTKGIGRGSGLGLSMVYGFVEQSGGHLHIDSRLGYGTRVELFLPIAHEVEAKPTEAPRPLSPGLGEIILIVEDEAEVREIAAAFVRSLGYRVHAVADAQQALNVLTADRTVALLFSDVMLGVGMNGKELAQSARELHPGLAVLLTSGYEDSANGIESEAFELLRKPYRLEDLAAALRRNLDHEGRETSGHKSSH